MVVVPQQSKIKIEDDDDEDVEALRLAALKSLRTKDATHKRSALLQVQKVFPQVTQPSRLPYKGQRPIKRNFYHNRSQQRQNGSPRNPNLIAIVPVDEPSPLQQAQLAPVEKTESCVESHAQEISKFHRFKDSGSASEDEDAKEQKKNVTSVKIEILAKDEPEESLAESLGSQKETTESSQKNGDNQEEDGNDDDDDVLLMADLEEEDSLERLMDEMEREMNDGSKLSEKKEKKLNRGETKSVVKSDEGNKNFDQRMKSDENCGKKDRNNTITSSLTAIVKNDRRSVSPHVTNRIQIAQTLAAQIPKQNIHEEIAAEKVIPERKHGPRSITPDVNRDEYARELSPIFKSTASPEISRVRTKQKDEAYERPATTIETAKESVDTISDPVLEARRKKFESTRPIDPVNANKKIKLSKKHTTNTKVESSEGTEIPLGGRKANKTVEEFEVQELDLCLAAGYEFEEFEEAVENTSPTVITSSVNTCIDVEPQKTEKEKSLKKKKKRDKELYQVGKLKNELPLSERIGKDKKCKKRKEMVSEEDVDTVFEDIAVDEEGDLRTELSRRRAERLNRTVPVQSARLVQSAFKGVVNEVVKNNAKANQRHVINTDEKSNQKEVRRVTVLHRSLTELHDSEDESTLDSKVPVRFRLGLNKQVQESRESKVTRKASKRQGRKICKSYGNLLSTRSIFCDTTKS
ncbi:serine threonine-protein kinase prp4-like protein [Lasius niger]|uniref:Serine threonine-protein kinase prp4-like protein n=1 Tax=Lasius niger TaxID=67767 RepID=A0A0J7KS61_LASNI|nr:serine threonine-protein kinase prp4-like protein [Lasius niger]